LLYRLCGTDRCCCLRCSSGRLWLVAPKHAVQRVRLGLDLERILDGLLLLLILLGRRILLCVLGSSVLLLLRLMDSTIELLLRIILARVELLRLGTWVKRLRRLLLLLRGVGVPSGRGVAERLLRPLRSPRHRVN